MLAYSQGDNQRAADAAARAAGLAREVGDKRALAIVLAFQASSLMFIGEGNAVLALLEEAMVAGRESGDKLALGMPMGMYAQASAMVGAATEQAREFGEKGVALMQESGDRWAATMALSEHGYGGEIPRRLFGGPRTLFSCGAAVS